MLHPSEMSINPIYARKPVLKLMVSFFFLKRVTMKMNCRKQYYLRLLSPSKNILANL